MLPKCKWYTYMPYRQTLDTSSMRKFLLESLVSNRSKELILLSFVACVSKVAFSCYCLPEHWTASWKLPRDVGGYHRCAAAARWWKSRQKVRFLIRQSDFQPTQKLVKWQCFHLVMQWFDKICHLQTLAYVRFNSDVLTRFSPSCAVTLAADCLALASCSSAQ